MTATASIAVVFLQPHCNMRCNFCVTEENFCAMSFEQALQLLDHLESRSVRTVIFGGGEPFAWAGDVVALSQEAKTRGFMVQIGTNGIAMPDHFEHIESIDRYVLPLESVHAETHNRMRDYFGRHHEVILDRLARLKAVSKSVTISTVVTAVNRDEILDIGHYLRDYHAGTQHVHAWHLYQFLPMGRGGEANADQLLIPEEEYLRIINEVQDLELDFRIYRRSNMYRSKTIDFYWFSDGQLMHGDLVWDLAMPL